MKLMYQIIKKVYDDGVESLISKIKDKFTRRAAASRCKRCKKYSFNSMYWSCLECEFCCHLINLYLHEKEDTGVLVGQIDKIISNIFARHFREQIREAKKDSKKPSDDHFIKYLTGRDLNADRVIRTASGEGK